MRRALWQEGEWRVISDPACKHPYFHNTKTGVVTWLPPPVIVTASRLRTVLYETKQWQVLQDRRQKPYYHNRTDGSSLWTIPAGLSELHAEAVKHGKMLLEAVAGMQALKLAEEEGDGSFIPPDTEPQVQSVLKLMTSGRVDPVGVWSVEDERGRNSFMNVCAMGNRKLASQMLAFSPPLERRDKEGWTALGLMALAGESVGVQDLMDAGADVTSKNQDGFYIWEAALDAGFSGVSAIIKAKHASINLALVTEKKAAKEQLRNMKFNTIFEAAAAGHSGQMQWFLVTNPELIKGVTEEGYTILITVARGGFWLVCDMLIRRGADIDAVDPMGWTACMHAASCNHLTTVSYLLAAGADPHIKSKAGLTASQLTSCSLVRETIEASVYALSQPPPPSLTAATTAKPSLLSARGPKPRTARGVLFTESAPSVFSYDNGPEEGEEETTVTIELKAQPLPALPPPSFSAPPLTPGEASTESKENANLPAKIKMERKAIAPAAAPKKKAVKF